ncbi:hypothetical protein G6011_07378 [Alternaria panax]|uniref:LysM domain-containing protein n=1 Tax=Alternaria panax TaxID=48097 RepID=A0AAD4FGS7_9PLEO|nr:hypothetical protein G6011_07378 [Alternaria panax]
MQLTQFFAIGLLVASASAWSAHLRRADDCEFFTSADNGMTCETFAAKWHLSVDELERLNPGIICTTLDSSDMYCVVGTNTNDSVTTTTSAAITTAPLTTITSSASTSVSSTTTKASITTTASKGVATSFTSSGLPVSTDAADAVRVSVIIAGILGWAALVL